MRVMGDSADLDCTHEKNKQNRQQHIKKIERWNNEITKQQTTTHRPRHRRPIALAHLEPPVLVLRRPVRARLVVRLGRVRLGEREQLLFERVEEEPEELLRVFLVPALYTRVISINISILLTSPLSRRK